MNPKNEVAKKELKQLGISTLFLEFAELKKKIRGRIGHDKLQAMHYSLQTEPHPFFLR